MSQQINLFNPIFLQQKKYFSAVAMLQALALLLAGMAVLYGFEVRQKNGLQLLQAQAEKQALERRAQLIRFGKEFSDQGKSKKLDEEIAQVEPRLRSRQELLNEITTGISGNVEGFSQYMSALARQHVNGVWLTAVNIGGRPSDLVIKGKVLNGDLVPVYVRSLSREPALAGRRVSELQLIARETAPAAAGAPARAAAPGTPPPASFADPARFVEFTLSIPLGDVAAAPAAKPAAPGKGAT